MHGAIPPLPNTPSCGGAQLKNSTVFLLLKCTNLHYYLWFVWACNLMSCPKGKHRLRVVENRGLRRIFGPKKMDVTRRWRSLHNEKRNLHFLPNIIRVIKSSITFLTSRVAPWGCEKCLEQNGRDRLEELGVDGMDEMDLRDIERESVN